MILGHFIVWSFFVSIWFRVLNICLEARVFEILESSGILDQSWAAACGDARIALLRAARRGVGNLDQSRRTV